jgi:hypothetical protein
MKKLLFLLIICCLSFSSQAQTADTTLKVTLLSKAPDVTSVTYQWTKISGPTAGTISTPTSSTTAVTGLVIGKYVFQCIATDNFGVASNPSIWNITVVRNAIAPTISAGQDIILKAK